MLKNRQIEMENRDKKIWHTRFRLKKYLVKHGLTMKWRKRGNEKGKQDLD